MSIDYSYKPGDLKAVNVGKGNFVLNGLEAKPISIHLKEDATLDNKPGFMIVMHMPGHIVGGQISLGMLNRAMNELGYEITKVSDK